MVWVPRVLAAVLLTACGDSASPPASPAGRTVQTQVVESLLADLAAERHPSDGGGRAWLDLGGAPAQTVARRPGRFPIVFEAGPLGVAVGGRVLLQVSPFWGWSSPQVSDPEGPGYTRVETDAEGVELEVAALDRQLLAIGVAGRALAPGERIRMVYGAGPAGARADRYAERGSRFWIGVDGDGDGVRAFIESSPTVQVLPGPAVLLVLTLPATARPGDTVRLGVAVLDALGSTGVPFAGELALEATAGLEVPERVVLAPEQEGRLSLPVRVTAPGVQRVLARGPGELVGESPPLRVDAAAPRVLWGDLHGHSNLSDGTGTPDEYYRYAREVSALDVVSLTDHDHWGMPFLDQSPGLWEEIQQATRRFHEPGRMVTLLGWEWTSWIYGHRHVLHFEDRGEILSSIDAATDEPGELWAALRGRPALTFAHHSAGGPIATDWSVPPDPVLEPVTEIVSAHGSSEALDSPIVIYAPVPGNFVRDALGLGYRLGFVGSGDSHDGHPGLVHLAAASGGLAGILAEDLSREAVLAALRARRCYATNGPRIVLEATLAGRPMGAVVPAGSQRLALRLAAPEPLAGVDLVRGSEVVGRIPLEGEREASLELELPDLQPGEWVYVRAVQRDGGAAWSSPFFVE